MWTKTNGSRLIAGALAIMMMAPMGIFATGAQAQTGPSTTGSPPSAQVPQPDEGGVNWQGVGYGAGALFSNVLYIPAKLLYAIFGGIIGGGAYVVTGGNGQTSDTIWRSALGGDYVVTPDMLEGKEPLHFSGPTETAPPPPNSTVQPLSAAPAYGPAAAYTPAPSYSSAPRYSAPAARGAQPMDRGAGSVGRPSGSSTLPDTSIE